METLENADCVRHRVSLEHAGAEDRFAQPRDLAVLVQRAQLVRDNLRDLQAAGVGANINRGKRRHRGLMRSKNRNSASSPKIHDAEGVGSGLQMRSKSTAQYFEAL